MDQAGTKFWAEGEFGQKAKCGAEGVVVRTLEEGARGVITRDDTQIINVISCLHTQAAHLNPIYRSV